MKALILVGGYGMFRVFSKKYCSKLLSSLIFQTHLHAFIVIPFGTNGFYNFLMNLLEICIQARGSVP